MNRRGDERILSLYWFVMFIIIALPIVSGVVMFYSSPYDVRTAEANILADRVIDCIAENGRLKEQIMNSDFAMTKECGLNFDDASHEAYKTEMQYYAEASFGDKTISMGEKKWKAYCGAAKSDKNVPVCAKRKIVLLNGNEKTIVDVTTAVRKVEQSD